jgi:hypothetical protein
MLITRERIEMRRLAGQEQLMDSVFEKRESPTINI